MAVSEAPNKSNGFKLLPQILTVPTRIGSSPHVSPKNKQTAHNQVYNRQIGLEGVQGASSVQFDDPSKDDEGNNRNNQPLRPKRNQEYRKNSNEAKSDKDSGKSKNTQAESGKHRNKKLNTLGGYAGRVMVGDRKQPICIPAGTSKVVIGKTQEKLPRGSYMVEATDDDNLPCGVSVNHTYVNPTKAKQVSVILLNTNSYNVWI